MTALLHNVLPVLAVFFTFGLVIFLHELGHFLVCKGIGVRVERFAFGFGPELIGFTRGATRYSVCAFPLGGFVKPAGEDPDEATGQPDEFFSKPWYGRIAIALAGPAMNYVLAFTLFFSVIFLWGLPQTSSEPVIGGVVSGMPADQAGLKEGDRILSVDGQAMARWEDVAGFIHSKPNKTLSLKIDRHGQALTVALKPKEDPERGIGLIGISPMSKLEPVSSGAALKQGLWQTVYWTKYTVTYLGTTIYKMKRPEVAGPVGIVQVIHKAAQSGLQDWLYLTALISLSIGLFNLFPIPMLDGGHVFFYLIEGLLRKPLNKKITQTANMVGFALLLAILFFATYSDIERNIGALKKAPAEKQTVR